MEICVVRENCFDAATSRALLAGLRAGVGPLPSRLYKHHEADAFQRQSLHN
jgi:hypothetical protein